MAASPMWLFPFKLCKTKYNCKCLLWAVLAPFHTLKSHRRLVAAVLSGREREHSHHCGTDSRAAWSLRRATTVALGRCLYPGNIRLCEQTCSLEGGWNSWKADVLELALKGWVGGYAAQLPHHGGGMVLRCHQWSPRGPGGPELQVPLAVTR